MLVLFSERIEVRFVSARNLPVLVAKRDNHDWSRRQGYCDFTITTGGEEKMNKKLEHTTVELVFQTSFSYFRGIMSLMGLNFPLFLAVPFDLRMYKYLYSTFLKSHR